MSKQVREYLGVLTCCCSLLLIAGCTGAKSLTLPSPKSFAAVPRYDGLHAGFGKTDITPPPGVPISGYGPEGRQSVGYRHRLYVRTLAFEDAGGERVVISVADLPHISILLHRYVSDRLLKYGYGIGADRFMLSATHTHAGPGNFYEAEQYNGQAGALPGYDSLMVEFLVERIAVSVMSAIDSLQPVRVSFGRMRVPNVTINRSADAHRLTRSYDRSDTLAAEYRAGGEPEVDDHLYMLRVDDCRSDRTHCQPWGALSVFAIHGTGDPAANRLLGGGIHSVVARHLEEHIDTLQSNRGVGSTSFHLVANGAEGDVSPNFDPRTRCEGYYRFKTDLGPSGHRRPQSPEVWQIDPRDLAECLQRSGSEVNRLGDMIGQHAVRLFDRLDTEGHMAAGTRISRAFNTVDLSELWESGLLCEPRIGTAALGGSSEDGKTRLSGWSPFWLVKLGFTEGGRAVAGAGTGCHGKKRIFLGGLQRRIVGKYGFPTAAQLAVVKVGRIIYAFLPGEPTTAVGDWIKSAIKDSVGNEREVDHVVVVGLANGYLQYVTRPEEYAAQHYEGGSTLYGPQTASVFVTELARLAGSLQRGEPVSEVTPVGHYPGKSKSYFPSADRGPEPSSITRRFTDARCGESIVTARWVDLYPGRLVPADSRIARVARILANGDRKTVGMDGDRGVEVRAVAPRKRAGYEWEMTWSGTTVSGEHLEIELFGRQGMPSIKTTVACG